MSTITQLQELPIDHQVEATSNTKPVLEQWIDWMMFNRFSEKDFPTHLRKAMHTTLRGEFIEYGQMEDLLLLLKELKAPQAIIGALKTGSEIESIKSKVTDTLKTA